MRVPKIVRAARSKSILTYQIKTRIENSYFCFNSLIFYLKIWKNVLKADFTAHHDGGYNSIPTIINVFYVFFFDLGNSFWNKPTHTSNSEQGRFLTWTFSLLFCSNTQICCDESSLSQKNYLHITIHKSK